MPASPGCGFNPDNQCKFRFKMTSQTQHRHKLIVYGHNYCPQAKLLISALNKHQVQYDWRDVIQGDPRFQAELRELAHGNLSVPTLIFPDGVVMVEPWPNTVLRKLNLQSSGWLSRIITKIWPK
jgi:mycoredoxin